jgi:hypothetical protein
MIDWAKLKTGESIAAAALEMAREHAVAEIVAAKEAERLDALRTDARAVVASATSVAAIESAKRAAVR